MTVNLFCFGFSLHFPAQISIGYFLTDLAMILWNFPALGGLEYVSRYIKTLAIISMHYLINYF